jgi:RNA polymerase sigma factor (sigma-70 family)
MMVAGELSSNGAAMTRSSDLDDFGAFYEATYERAYRAAVAIVGEPALAVDVVQDAYLSAFRGRSRFRQDGPAEAWLVRIVVNQAISAARRRRIRWVEPPQTITARGDDPGQSVERLSMVEALQVLPPKERAAVVMRFYLDYDYATIARCLDTTSGTVGSWLSRAMGRLRTEFGRTGEASNSRRTSGDRDVT